MDEIRKKTNPRDNRLQGSAGFTLIELLIVIAISSVVLAGIYSVFRNQLKAANTNTQVVMMQQNLRASMAIMERDIRMAGYSPSGNADAGFVTAQEGIMQLTIDWNNDGDVADPEEDITYRLAAANDTDDDGLVEVGGVAAITRNTQPMAQDMEAVAFAYAFDDDQDGNLDVDGGSNIIWAIDSDGDGDLDTNVISGSALGTAVDFDKIQAVRIWLMARSNQTIRSYTNNANYQVGRQNVAGGGDAFMRRMLQTIVKCRNMTF
jgi:type IV pilus assembly protein PilW